MDINPDLSNLLLFICLLSSSHTYLAWKPLNPPLKTPHKASNSAFVGCTNNPTRFLCVMNLLFGTYYFFLLYPRPKLPVLAHQAEEVEEKQSVRMGAAPELRVLHPYAGCKYGIPLPR